MSKPYYVISEHDKEQVLTMIKAADSVCLGNLIFSYFVRDIITMHLCKVTSVWALTVAIDCWSSGGYSKRDIYEISCGEFIYKGSERDDNEN